MMTSAKTCAERIAAARGLVDRSGAFRHRRRFSSVMHGERRQEKGYGARIHK